MLKNNDVSRKAGNRGNRKAQVQMGESIAVIIIITIMIFFGLAFYSRIKTVDLEQQSRQFSEYDVVKLANVVSNMPEILCSQQKVIDVNCLDKYKLIALQNSVKEGAAGNAFFYYRSLFGNSRIRVEQLYPQKRNYTLYENNLTADQSIETITIPVNIYNALNDTRAFGVLLVEAYS